jgi:hypothetical protein
VRAGAEEAVGRGGHRRRRALMRVTRHHVLVMLQITFDASISSALSLAPGRICMIAMYSQIASSRSMLVPVFRSRL